MFVNAHALTRVTQQRPTVQPTTLGRSFTSGLLFHDLPRQVTVTDVRSVARKEERYEKEKRSTGPPTVSFPYHTEYNNSEKTKIKGEGKPPTAA